MAACEADELLPWLARRAPITSAPPRVSTRNRRCPEITRKARDKPMLPVPACPGSRNTLLRPATAERVEGQPRDRMRSWPLRGVFAHSRAATRHAPASHGLERTSDLLPRLVQAGLSRRARQTGATSQLQARRSARPPDPAAGLLTRQPLPLLVTVPRQGGCAVACRCARSGGIVLAYYRPRHSRPIFHRFSRPACARRGAVAHDRQRQ